jgi:hypothetical protein
MKTGNMIASAVISVLLLASAVGVYAEEKKMVLNAADGIREVLTANVGKRVSVKTDAGEAMEGSVVMVGHHLVQLEKLSGKDFYDAVVKIDRISSVTLRVR